MFYISSSLDGTVKTTSLPLFTLGKHTLISQIEKEFASILMVIFNLTHIWFKHSNETDLKLKLKLWGYWVGVNFKWIACVRVNLINWKCPSKTHIKNYFHNRKGGSTFVQFSEEKGRILWNGYLSRINYREKVYSTAQWGLSEKSVVYYPGNQF